MDPREIELAYEYWRQAYLQKDADELVEPFLKPPKWHWIRLAREALFLKSDDVAAKLGLSRNSFSRLERQEKDGAIKLKTLKEIAEAMDCELIYAIRPKNRKRFSQIVWPQVYPDFLKHHWLEKCDPKRRAGALAFLAREATLSAKYRRAKGWCRKP